MPGKLDGKRVAILATDGFEEVELTEPKQALEEAGARVEVVSPKSGQIQGMRHLEKGQGVKVDRELGQANPSDYDALMLPGGLANPDALRQNEKALAFVRAFFEAAKPVAAICHAPQILISADLVRGRTMTSWEAVQKDLQNAGAAVRDKPVVVDKGLVTSRKPDDIPQFNAKMIEEFAEGRHDAQRRSAA
jgi:protease I